MQNTKKIIWRLWVGITLVIILYFGVRAKELIVVRNQLDERLVRAYEELAQEEASLALLQEERENMDTLEYIEKIAREKLGMVKEDDIVFKEKYK